MGSFVLGAGISLLESCGTTSIYKAKVEAKQIKVPISQLQAQQKLVIRVADLPYDILVVKKSDNEYKALYLMCTHQDNPVSVGNMQLSCNVHGSLFSLEGEVLNGPAQSALKTFKTQVNSEFIFINL